MKLSTSVLALLLVKNVSAFTSPMSGRASVSVSSSVAETSDVKADPLADVKYETTVNVEQKFKVADIDPKVNDKKFRVQT